MHSNHHGCATGDQVQMDEDVLRRADLQARLLGVLRRAELAAVLGVSASWLEHTDLPFVKAGGVVLYVLADVRVALAGQSAAAAGGVR